jgi:hypothetical protein
MDYTDNPSNNLLPGSFNLDLLVSLYGTPTQPRIEAPDLPIEEPSMVDDTTPTTGTGDSNIFDNIWDNVQQTIGNEDQGEDEPERDEKDSDKDDDRRYLRSDDGEDDESEDDSSDDPPAFVNYESLSKRAEKECKKGICSFDVGDGCLIHVHKFLVA